jgi:DNA polymerase
VAAKVLDESSRRAVAEAVRYYRELGIYDLYRRDVPADAAWLQAIAREELAVPADAVLATAQGAAYEDELFASASTNDPIKLPAVLADKPAALKVIRDDLGDCQRCRLGATRTNLVFGVGRRRASCSSEKVRVRMKTRRANPLWAAPVNC